MLYFRSGSSIINSSQLNSNCFSSIIYPTSHNVCSQLHPPTFTPFVPALRCDLACLSVRPSVTWCQRPNWVSSFNERRYKIIFSSCTKSRNFVENHQSDSFIVHKSENTIFSHIFYIILQPYTQLDSRHPHVLSNIG